MLEPGLADALRDAAVELAVDDRRVDALPDIVHPDEAPKLDGAGIGIDFDLAGVGSIGDGGAIALEVGTRAAIAGGIRVPGKRSAELQESDSDIGAGHRESAGPETDVLARRLQGIGGMGAQLVHETVGGAQQGGSRALQRCRSPGCRTARGEEIGIALNQLDRLRRHAEMPGKEQGKRRLVALPDRLLTDVHNNPTLRIHFHCGGFAGAGPGGVQVEPEAESAPSSRGTARGAARLEGVPARLAKRRAHHPGKVAAIPDLAVRRAVGHLPGGDEIAFAQCHAIDPGLPCRRIHQPLHHVHTLRLPRAAKRVDRGGMGVRRAHRQVEHGNAVEVGEGASKPDDGRGGRHRGRVRAHVAVGRAAQRQDSPLLVEGKLGDAVVAPRVGIGERGLGAGRHPAHRPAEHSRRDQHGALLRVVHELHSEAAAHVRRDHAKPALVDSQTRRDEGAHDVHALALRV